jgi:hypothetical protein
MSKVRSVLAVSVAVDPADAHVEASPSKLLREFEQRLSLLARHGSLARTTRPNRPAFVVQRAPLAQGRAAPSASAFDSVEKAAGRR